MKKYLFLFFTGIFLFSGVLNAQTWVNVSTGTWYDPGGTSNYGHSRNYVYTFAATSGQCSKIVFSSFATEANYDYLYMNTSSTGSGGTAYHGTSGPPTTYSSVGGNYYAKFTSDGSVDAAGWVATYSKVNQAAAPTSITGSQTICSGNSASLSASGGSSGDGTMTWYSGSCGGTYVGTGSSINVSPGATTTYYVRYNSPLCGSTTSCLSSTVTVSNPTGATISNALNAGTLSCGTTYTNTQNNSTGNCFRNDIGQASDDIYYYFVLGGSYNTIINISHCSSAFDTYMHLLNSGGTSITTNNDNGPLCSGAMSSISTELAPGGYYVVSEGYSTNSGSITTQINIPTPSGGSISGNSTPCTNATGVSYSISGTSYANRFQWTVPSGASISSGQGTSTITVNWGTTSGNVGCTPYNGSCAGTAVTYAVSLMAVPAQPSGITGATSPCVGSSQTYSVTNVSGVTYNWSFPSGWTQTGGGTSNSVTVTVGSGAGNITVTPSNACGNGTARTLAVTTTASPAQPGAISGTVTQCPGVSGQTYSISAVSGATTYTWSVPTGWSITGGQGSTSLTVTTGSTGQNGNISVTAGNTCGTSSAQTLAVTVGAASPAQPGAISGTTAQCPSTAGQTYSISAVSGASTYTWSVPTGWAITGGQGTTTLTVTTGTTGQNGNVSVTSGNSCGTSSAQNLAVTVGAASPAQPGSISGTTTQCPSLTGQTYSISAVSGASSYTWTVPTGWSITGGQGTTTLTVTTGFTGQNGNVSVTASNNCGTSSAQNLAVTVASTPGAVSVTGGVTGICGGTLLEASGGSGGTIYWQGTTSNGTSTANSNTLQTVTATGTYYFRAQSAGGCWGTQGSASVTITASPNPVDYSGLSTDDYVWAGTVSEDFETNNNWLKYNGTSFDVADYAPGSSDNVYIKAYGTCPDDMPVIYNAMDVNALTVASSGELTVNAGIGLTAWGALVNDGIITLESNSSNGTATLINKSSVSGSGTYNIKQYLEGAGAPGAPSGRMYYMASPLDNATSNVFNASSTSNKLWSYSEPTLAYTEITNNTTSLGVMQGYVARMGSNGTITFTGGKINSGNLSISVSGTGTTEPKRGYNLIGNPYPSYLDWEGVDTTHVSSTIWYRTSNGSSMLFDTYNSTSDIGTNNNGNGAVTSYIPPMQAFWVKVRNDNTTTSVSVKNSIRSHQSGMLLKTNPNNNTMRVVMSNGLNSDEAIILFNADAGQGYDDWDSEKMMTTTASVPQMWTLSGTTQLVINSMQQIVNGMTIPLYMTIQQAGQHSIDCNLSEFDLTTDVWLQDLSLGTMHDVRTGPYSFTSSNVTDNNRFVLHFSNVITGTEPSIETKSPITVYAHENTIYVNTPEKGIIEVYDIVGKLIAQQQATEGMNVVVVTSRGVYLVRVANAHETKIQKVTLW